MKRIKFNNLITFIKDTFKKCYLDDTFKALGQYIEKANLGSGYGAAGYRILILVYATYSSMLGFFTTEFATAYSDYYFSEVSAFEIRLNKLNN